MGLPFVAISLAAVIMFADLGMSPDRITFWTSLFILPYSLKFIWSPLLEIYLTKKKFVLICQMVSAVCFGLVAACLPLPNAQAMIVALMCVIGLSGATNDIATDGIYLTALDKKTQATYIGWQGAFYNLAKVLVNGVLVYAAGCLMRHFQESNPEDPHHGAVMAWLIIMLLIAVTMGALAAYHYMVLPRGETQTDSPTTFSAAMKSLWEVILDFFTKRYILLYILFIICYRLTEGLAVKMVPLFLKASTADGGLGLSNEQIGLIYGTLGTLAFIVGSILGGYYIARFTLRRTLLSLVAIFNVPFVIYYLFASMQPQSIVVIGAGLVAEYFCYGFGFVGLSLFMMQQVAPGRHPMAHYAFASAIMNLGFMVAGMASGWIYMHLGYEHFFLLALALCIPAFILAAVLPFAHSDNEQEQTQN
jgi:PAT family beta-lactamase induction signal transducer AmpG